MDKNHGFDDEQGNYLVQIGDHLGYRFEVLGVLGNGSFGSVVRCFDHKHKMTRAVKIIKNKKRFRQQGMIEVSDPPPPPQKKSPRNV